MSDLFACSTDVCFSSACPTVVASLLYSGIAQSLQRAKREGRSASTSAVDEHPELVLGVQPGASVRIRDDRKMLTRYLR